MAERWTSLTLIQWTANYFEKKGIPNPRLDAELLLAHALGHTRVELYTQHDRTVAQKDLDRFRTLVERRATREPLQYILGETEFWGLKIKVTPEVLIPRPETELLVEEAMKAFSPLPNPLPRDGGEGGESRVRGPILEIGTGSGCIAIALAKNLPQSRITATDISKEALAIAKKNAEENGVADRIHFVLADLAPWRVFQAEETRFDLIISNPPYIASGEIDTLQAEVSRFEPRRALDGGSSGLEIIQKILQEAPDFLRPNGLLLLEIGEDQAEVLKESPLEKLTFESVKKDPAGFARLLAFRRRFS